MGTLMHWEDVFNGPVPEVALGDWRTMQETGYAQSKAVSERLLEHAACASNVDCIICRIGQVAGPISRRGMWNPKEWFPSLIHSSAFSKMLPGDLGPVQAVDWIPIDILAKRLVELALQSPHPRGKPRTNAVPIHETLSGHVKEAAQVTVQTSVYHGSRKSLDVEGAKEPPSHAEIYELVNPKRTDYLRLLPAVRSRLSPSVRIAPLEEWTEALASLANGNEADIKRNPAVKLVAFFQHLVEMKTKGHAMVTLDAQNACRVSQTLTRLGPVEAEWMRGWMLEWGSPGQPGQTDAN